MIRNRGHETSVGKQQGKKKTDRGEEKESDRGEEKESDRGEGKKTVNTRKQ